MAEEGRCDHRREGLPALDKPDSRRHHLLEPGIVGRGKISKSLGNHRTHTAEFRSFGDLVFKEIPVAKRCGSGQDHFCHCQDCTVVNHFLCDETRFHGENVMIKPVH